MGPKDLAEPGQSATPFSFLAGGGEMGERICALDWSATALGPVESWPQSLRGAVSTSIGSRFPIVLYWGARRVVLYNDAYAEILGGKHPWALGRPCEEVWSEIWSVIAPMFDAVVATGEATWSEDQLLLLQRRGYPEECYFSFSFSPVRGEDGAVEGIFTAVIENTRRVIGDRRMALITDLAARNATARTAHDACVLTMKTLAAHPADVTFALAYIDGALECATPGAEQQRAEAPPELVRELPITSTAGSRLATLLVGLNPRRPFDDQYRSFIDLVADQFGTALANARAYEEERRRAEALAEIDRAKTAFFNNVSHEFRTPLTLLLGPTQDALASPEQALTGEQLATVHRNALRLLKLVNTLLDFSRIEAGRAEAHFEPTDLSMFTADLAGAFRSAAESAGLRFDVDCAPLDLPVHVDRAMWEKIVFNLLSNALKFTFDGGIRLSLRRERDAAILTVADTGTGIDGAELPHIFERFHRVRGAKSRTHEGTGIGLALVQELVKLHGGTIAVVSDNGEGTTFTVSIPLAPASLAPVTMPDMRSASSMSRAAAPYLSEAVGWVKPASAPAAPSPASGRARVLVADDNADMRDYVSRLLGDRWMVETVGDGATALAAIHERPPDVIVSDVMMPEIDGVELLKAVKDDPATRDIPVILLSARAGEDSTLDGIGAGADDYLVKPFTARDLLARIDAQLHRASQQRRAREQLIEANRIKDEFLATLSHELRTPLNAILGWAHLLRSPAVQPGILERALESIQRNARAQAQLVDDLLDVSRVISGKLTIKREPVNLRAVISEAVDAVRASMTAKAVRLRMGVATDADIVIDGDSDRLRQVVWNLLSNAVKFTPSGGAVDIDVRRTTDAVEIAVRDSGMGITREFLPHVFERFRQGDSGPSRKHGGLGLGLAIVRHLVEAHGGTVTADSDGPGTGAQFIVRLPTESARPRPLSVVSHRPPAIDHLLAGMRVLMADDEADARDVMRVVLESHGAEVVSVASAAEALDALQHSAFDAVVADIGMPGEDGYSLMRAIRLLPADRGGTVPAIAVTAYATLRERDDALNAGFTAHIGKPFDPDRLVATISKIAQRRVSS